MSSKLRVMILEGPAVDTEKDFLMDYVVRFAPPPVVPTAGTFCDKLHPICLSVLPIGLSHRAVQNTPIKELNLF